MMIVEQRVGKFQIREFNNHVPRRLGTKGEILSYPDPGSGAPNANPTDSRRKPAALTKGIPRTTDMTQAYLVQSTAAREMRSYV